MRQLTSDEYNLLDDNSLRIHHWVYYDMTPEERKGGTGLVMRKERSWLLNILKRNEKSGERKQNR
jgi:hypothetical protein